MTYCVTSTPTIGDGTVLRWYSSEQQLTWGGESISASRNGVIGGDGQFLTPDLFKAAWDAHVDIAMGRDVSHLVTHRRKSFLGRDYERVGADVA